MNVRIDKEIHVETPDDVGVQNTVLSAVSSAGSSLQAMVAYGQDMRGHFIMLVSDATKAAKAAQKLGYNVIENDVVVAEFDDKKGIGAAIAEKLAKAGINVSYTYAGGKGKKVVCVLSTGDNAAAVQVLSGKAAGKKGKKK